MLSIEKALSQMEKNLIDWERDKRQGTCVMSDFHVEWACFSPLIYELKYERFEELTQSDKDRLAEIERRIEEIKKIK